MANPRTPIAKAKATGQTLRNPARFKARKEPPKQRPLGKPSAGLTERQVEAWEAFNRELPWLMESDRTIVETASRLRADMWDSTDINIRAMTLLRQCLSLLGATPADRTRIYAPPEEDEPDPAEAFLQ
jgi:hypothetical protein